MLDRISSLVSCDRHLPSVDVAGERRDAPKRANEGSYQGCNALQHGVAKRSSKNATHVSVLYMVKMTHRKCEGTPQIPDTNEIAYLTPVGIE